MDFVKSFEEYKNSPNIKPELGNMKKDRTYTVFSYMDIVYDFLVNYENATKIEWLQILYHYIVYKSFPHKKDEKIKDELIPLYELVLNELSDLNWDKSGSEDLIYSNKEFNIFQDVYRKYFIYELMELDFSLTGHNTLNHVMGVKDLSLHLAKQLKTLNLPIDIGVVLGASLGHDIGKYGVLDSAKHRVPYLHYYYTEEWFNRFNLEKIGHIATNHSTWDLELETLPIESLILIYADFRVKNRIIDGKYEMHIYTLDESFQVILDKLDNMNEEKEKRYKKVYSKLKDFEDYIKFLGVDTTLNGSLVKKDNTYYSLLGGEEIVNNTKHVAIEHNIYLMSKLINDEDFGQIIELARGESNWKMLRLYLQIFKDYSTYLTQRQKITTLHFLDDLLLHKDEDIRKNAAELIGNIIAVFDEEFRKEIPESIKRNNPIESSENLFNRFLKDLLYPNHKIADTQHEWLYNLKLIIKTLFRKCHKSKYAKYFDVINTYYENCDQLSRIGQFYLSQTINYLPIQYLDRERLDKLYFYVLKKFSSKKLEIRLSVMDNVYDMLDNIHDPSFIQPIYNYLESNLHKELTPAENYIKFKIAKKVKVPDFELIKLEKNYLVDKENMSEIFLKNLKTATEWTIKKINIDILYDQVAKNPSSLGFHTAMHLCNLIKVSATEKVRTYAGETLLKIFQLLPLEGRNDVSVELIRALELENYQFTKSIPDYLGQLILYLPPTELDEIIDDFESKIKVSNPQIIQLLLNTIGMCIQNYTKYMDLYYDDIESNNERFDRLLGLLLIPISSYNIETKTEALRVIATKLFNSHKLTLQSKFKIFNKIGKKILTLIDYNKDDAFLFFNNTASLNQIYRFLSDCENTIGPIIIDENKNIAFFPGTFDPFSFSHTQIAREIRNQGFEVYLAVDEFSWSKRTEPNKFRRDIINMSTANEFDIYLFPKEIPINLSNTNDLNILNELFPKKIIYIAVGSDVILNASAYKNNGDILNWAHIMFDRRSNTSIENQEILIEEAAKKIRKDVIRLSLPTQYEDISSSLIREGIDRNRDISKLIDPLAAEYIYKFGLYLREPQYKRIFETKTLDVDIRRNLTDEVLDYLVYHFGEIIDKNGLLDLRNKLSYRILILMDTETKKPLGFSTFYWVRSSMLYDEFRDQDVTDFIRKNTKGRTVLISSIYGMDNDAELIDIVINETLAVTINRDYNYAIYNNRIIKNNHTVVEDELEIQGFIKTIYKHNDNSLLIVDMNSPITLSFDLENMLKPPYDRDVRVLSVINKTRRNLKKALASLYPGELLLAFNKDMIYSKVIQKICDTNNVPTYDMGNRTLGKNMCVPFGIILNSTIIPNTVTKTIHTERMFSPDIQSFEVGSFPNYLSLEEQSKTIKSFNRPVILVDDLLNKGYRLNMIEPLLRKENIEIKKLMVGILSGKGREYAEILNIDVDYAYFIPTLKLWFNESNQYPYLGGDMVKRSNNTSILIPSINYILPYVSPRFIKGVSSSAIYKMSEVCLKNTFDILKIVELVYQELNEKSLNLLSLGEVLVSPRHPDLERNIDLSKNVKPSTFIEMDLDYLKRLENTIKR